MSETIPPHPLTKCTGCGAVHGIVVDYPPAPDARGVTQIMGGWTCKASAEPGVASEWYCKECSDARR